MKSRIFIKLRCFCVIFLIAAVFQLFAACKNPGQDENIKENEGTNEPTPTPTPTPGADTKIPFSWTFREDVPGWIPYEANNSATIMNKNAVYLNNMTLLAANLPIRWMPAQVTAISGFSNGCVQTAPETADAFLEIANVPGPFKITCNYANTGDNPGPRHPVLYFNNTKIRDGETASQTNGVTTKRTLEQSYYGSDKVNIQLGAVGGFRLYDVILVGETGIPVGSVSITGGDFQLTVIGAEKQLSATALPANAGDKTLQWSSSNPEIATVSAAGLVKAVSTGSAVITATARDGSGKSASVTVTVSYIPVQSITIADAAFSFAVGNVKALTVNIVPQDASNKGINWSSNNESAVTVSAAGVVTAKAAGTAVITAVSQDKPLLTGSVTVTVTAAASPMTPAEIFNSLKGQKVVTNGWADRANGGAGLSYANPANFILIDDESYPVAENKYKAFINANVTNASINSSTGVISGGTVNDSAKFIIISGDIDLSNGRINDNDKSFYDRFNTSSPYGRINGDIILNLGSNTTIIGINNARIKFGGIRINNKSNVIIRNVTFWDAHGSTERDTTTAGNSESKASIDALVVQGDSNGVWVDHCKFTDGTCNDMIRNLNHDGSFDIPKGKNITVSWNEFTNHDKVMLVAGSDSKENAVAVDRQITLHHNYFHGTTQRMPRTRGTQMHVYNNYYNDIGVPGNTGSFMGPGWGAEFIVENNYFGPKSNKTIEWFDTNPTEYPVKFYYSGNNIADSNITWWGRASNPKPWQPLYIYTPDPNDGLPISVPAEAGPTLVFRK
jgi:pectate lyase